MDDGYNSCSSHSSSSSREGDAVDNSKPDSVVVHLDVDAFYCQCEEIRNPHLASRPLAVGQKHIVVTCNYAARARGVRKLMRRSEARAACPDLVIVEGSDLEPYRRQSRRIYDSFRGAVAGLPGGGVGNPSKRGGMDEMYSDISAAVRIIRREGIRPGGDDDAAAGRKVFVYGEDKTSTAVYISEDQSGATTRIPKSPSKNSAYESNRWGEKVERDLCIERLRIAADLAGTIRHKVNRESGFRASIGVSVSPMLAKLASEIRKPNSLNILQPWRAPEIIDAMPLRKIPGMGSRTLRSLEACLGEHNTRPTSYWTCSDLLQVPRATIAVAIGEDQCDLLMERCRGIDTRRIVDDNGGLAKTVSVEDSYKRGSLTTMVSVSRAMEALYTRLPRLLDHRRLNSELPDMSFPSTIKFTVRFVDRNIATSRRSFASKSKQSNFNGRNLMGANGEGKRSEILRTAIQPLMDCILLRNMALDVTKLNIAVTGFADLSLQSLPSEPKQLSVLKFFCKGKGLNMMSPTSNQIKVPQDGMHTTVKRKAVPTLHAMFHEQKKQQKHSHQSKLVRAASAGAERVPKNEVDPSYLSALPPDIREEVEREMEQQIAAMEKGWY